MVNVCVMEDGFVEWPLEEVLPRPESSGRAPLGVGGTPVPGAAGANGTAGDGATRRGKEIFGRCEMLSSN